MEKLVTTELIGQINHGDETAFRELYDRYYPQLFLFARHLVTFEDAQDAISIVFTKVWENRELLANIEDTYTYLKVAVKNTCFNILKKEKYSEEARRQIAKVLQQDEQYSFEHWQLKADTYEVIKQELDKLAAQDRHIFELAYWQGLKNAEIADLMNLSEKTVRNRRSLALAQLKVAFKDKPIYILLLFLMEQ